MRRFPVTAVALVLALLLVGVLGWQNRTLRAERDWLVERAAHPYYGMYVPVAELRDLDGRPVRPGAPAGDFQILYFFNARCPHCRDSAPMVRELAARAGRLGGVEMIGLGNGDAAEIAAYADEHRFDFPVATLRDRRLLSLFRGNSVPLVLLLGADGRVLHSQLGTLDTMDQVGSLLAAMRTDTPIATAMQAKE